MLHRKQAQKYLIVLGLSFSLLSSNVLACTTVVAGKKATADGSVLVARNEDMTSAWTKHFVVKPRTVNKKGEVFKAADNGFEYPLPEISYKYTSTPDWDPSEGYFEEAGINEFQVAVSATESANYNDKAKAADPLVEDGITEASITSVILPRIKTAKEGVVLVGKIIEEKGAGEVFGLTIADPNEAWYVEAGSGHRWAAVRVPDDSYLIAANQLRIGEVNLEDEANFMGSKDLITFASVNGLYDPAKDGSFNFAKAFGTSNDKDNIYNYPRVWWGQKLLSPSLNLKQGTNDYPLFAKPDQLLKVKDVMNVLRSHYNGSEFDNNLEKRTKELRPISVNTTMESHVLQLRSTLPNPIGGVHWLALGVPETSVYVPFYSGISETPALYKEGTDVYDTKSAYWAFRAVSALVNSNYLKYAGDVIKTWQDFENKAFEEQALIDEIAKGLYNKDKKQCEKYLTDYSMQKAMEAVSKARELEKDLITKQTEEPKHIINQKAN